MSNGFSRRCETGASSEVTGAAPFGSAPKVRCPLAEYTPLSDRETDPADRSRARCGRVRDHLEPVRAAVEAGPRRAPAGQPELVAPGEDVAQPGEEPEPCSLLVPERDVEPVERLDLVPFVAADDPAGDDGEERGPDVGGRERARLEGDLAEQVVPVPAEGDRPRDPERLGADRLNDDGSGRRGGALERARERHAQRNANGGARAQEEVSRLRGEPDGRRPFGLALDPDPDPDRPGREVPDEQLLRAVPAGPWGLAEGEAPRLDRDLAGCGGTGVDDARALPRDRLAPARSRRLREQRGEGAGVESRSGLGEKGGGACDDRGGGARAVHGAEAGRPGRVGPRLRGGEGDSRRDEVRRHPAVEGETCRGERRDLPGVRVPRRLGDADRDARVGTAAERPEQERRRVRRQPDRRSGGGRIEPERAARKAAAVDDDRGGSGARRL